MTQNKSKHESECESRIILSHYVVYRCPGFVSEVLTATSKHQIEQQGILATRLCTHKEDVNQINTYHLNKLKSECINIWVSLH